MSFITTHSGRSVHLANPMPWMIQAEDIGLALSRICRFGGHTIAHYSVAQHSYLASMFVPEEHQLTALLHDATEAYLGDMVSPLKALLPEYKRIEGRLWRVIAERFGAQVEMPWCVHNIDLILLATERRDLLNDQGLEWPCLRGVGPLPITIEPWSMEDANRHWMRRFHELQAERGTAPTRAAS